jgi:hypothetical protein
LAIKPHSIELRYSTITCCEDIDMAGFHPPP